MPSPGTLSEIVVTQMYVPLRINADTATNGLDVDLKNLLNTRQLRAHVDLTRVAGNVTVKIQESDTGGGAGYTDITGATTAALAASGAADVYFSTRKRYVRAVLTTAGTADVTPGVVLLTGGKYA